MTKQLTEHLRYGSPSAIPKVESRSTIDTLLSHQSYRAFSEQPIVDDIKQLLFAAAQSAPSKSNLQQYSFIDVDCSSVRKELIQIFPSIRWALDAPLLIFVIGDTHRTQEINRVRNHSYRWEQTDAFLNAAVDASLALGFLIVAAEGLGIGTCPISSVRESGNVIAKLLKLPKARLKQYHHDCHSRLLSTATPTSESISVKLINMTRHSTAWLDHQKCDIPKNLASQD